MDEESDQLILGAQRRNSSDRSLIKCLIRLAGIRRGSDLGHEDDDGEEIEREEKLHHREPTVSLLARNQCKSLRYMCRVTLSRKFFTNRAFS